MWVSATDTLTPGDWGEMLAIEEEVPNDPGAGDDWGEMLPPALPSMPAVRRRRKTAGGDREGAGPPGTQAAPRPRPRRSVRASQPAASSSSAVVGSASGPAQARFSATM